MLTPVSACLCLCLAMKQGEQNYNRRREMRREQDQELPIAMKLDTSTLPPSSLLPASAANSKVESSSSSSLMPLRLPPASEARYQYQSLSDSAPTAGVLNSARLTRSLKQIPHLQGLLDAGEWGLEALRPPPFVVDDAPVGRHPLATGSPALDWLPLTICALATTVQSLGHCSTPITP
jgi:hypothetical protein